MEIFTNLGNSIVRFFRPSLFKTQSFTYYIPSPPPRKSGYREKEFDKIFFKLINQGFEILSFKTIPHTGEKQSGFWVCFILRSKTKNNDFLDNELSPSTESEDASMKIYYESEFSMEEIDSKKNTII